MLPRIQTPLSTNEISASVLRAMQTIVFLTGPYTEAAQGPGKSRKPDIWFFWRFHFYGDGVTRSYREFSGFSVSILHLLVRRMGRAAIKL
jgi:hypothetical protein